MTKTEYERLVAEVNRLRGEIHLFNNEEVSEAILDDLKHKITQFELEHPDQISVNSPNYTIAGGVTEKFEKFRHPRRMLSLNDIFNLQEFLDWEKSWQDFYRKEYGRESPRNISPKYICEPKIDGLAISLHYQDGFLRFAATRGDGWVGELVTQNILQIKNIPKQIPDKRKIEVRGEVFITKKDFEKLNKNIAEGRQVGRMGKTGPEAMFVNPRNAASGTVRQLDSAIVSARNLSFVAYNVWIED